MLYIWPKRTLAMVDFSGNDDFCGIITYRWPVDEFNPGLARNY
jgi:hypothetical protein